MIRAQIIKNADGDFDGTKVVLEGNALDIGNELGAIICNIFETIKDDPTLPLVYLDIINSALNMAFEGLEEFYGESEQNYS